MLNPFAMLRKGRKRDKKSKATGAGGRKGSGQAPALSPEQSTPSITADASQRPIEDGQERAKQVLEGAGAAVPPTAVPSPRRIPSHLQPAGFSFSNRRVTTGQSSLDHAWEPGDHQRFRLRVGPNYKKYGRKEPSGPVLLELLEVDLFKSSALVHNLGEFIALPEPRVPVPEGSAVPPIFVVHGSLPFEAPSMLGNSNGPTLNAVFYFGLREETQQALASLETAPKAVQLLETFCRSAHADPSVFNRFKCIGMLRNYEEVGMPSIMKGYNGKPVLIRNRSAVKGGSGVMDQQQDSIIMHVNVRLWPLLARTGLHTLFGASAKCDLDVGFTIEGRADDELPEVLLGAVHIAHLRLDELPQWPPPIGGGGAKLSHQEGSQRGGGAVPGRGRRVDGDGRGGSTATTGISDQPSPSSSHR